MDSLALICDKTIVSDRAAASIASPVLGGTNLVDKDNGGGGRFHNLRNGRKPVKLQKESPSGCAGEGKQSKEN